MTEQSRLVEYTIRFHQLLRKSAKRDKPTGDYIFEGKVAALYDTLGISRTYYSRMMEVLQENGSIEYIQKGTRHYQSRIRMHAEPTPEEIEAYTDLTRVIPASRVSGRNLDSRVSQIERRLGSLDVVEALANMESRLRTLEATER